MVTFAGSKVIKDLVLWKRTYESVCYNAYYMILLDRVSKSYGKSRTSALDRITMHIEPKEFVIIIGKITERMERKLKVAAGA